MPGALFIDALGLSEDLTFPPENKDNGNGEDSSASESETSSWTDSGDGSTRASTVSTAKTRATLNNGGLLLTSLWKCKCGSIQEHEDKEEQQRFSGSSYSCNNHKALLDAEDGMTTRNLPRHPSGIKLSGVDNAVNGVLSLDDDETCSATFRSSYSGSSSSVLSRSNDSEAPSRFGTGSVGEERPVVIPMAKSGSSFGGIFSTTAKRVASALSSIADGSTKVTNHVGEDQPSFIMLQSHDVAAPGDIGIDSITQVKDENPNDDGRDESATTKNSSSIGIATDTGTMANSVTPTDNTKEQQVRSQTLSKSCNSSGNNNKRRKAKGLFFRRKSSKAALSKEAISPSTRSKSGKRNHANEKVEAISNASNALGAKAEVKNPATTTTLKNLVGLSGEDVSDDPVSIDQRLVEMRNEARRIKKAAKKAAKAKRRRRFSGRRSAKSHTESAVVMILEQVTLGPNHRGKQQEAMIETKCNPNANVLNSNIKNNATIGLISAIEVVARF